MGLHPPGSVDTFIHAYLTSFNIQKHFVMENFKSSFYSFQAVMLFSSGACMQVYMCMLYLSYLGPISYSLAFLLF